MNILIISNHSYPMQGPRAFRTAELSEQLAKMGHNVVLYTVHGKQEYTDYEATTSVRMRDIKPIFATAANDGSHRYNAFDKLMYHFFRRLLFWPQCEFHFSVSRIIRENPCMDMLITIAFPHSIHSGAARAKRLYPDIFPKTWIADCGDPFMLNPFVKFPRYMERFEKQWCAECDYITVPTENSKEGYYPEFRDKIRVIPQGFDFSKTPVDTYVKNEVPTFLFMGTVYPGIRDPHSFMDFLLNYKKPYKLKMMMRSPLEDIYPQQSGGQIEYIIGKGRKDVVWECSKADFLINVTNPNTAQTPSKLIDYGISGRPVLDVANNFTDSTVFEEFMSGNYEHQHRIDFLDAYRIENVAQAFVDLAKR